MEQKEQKKHNRQKTLDPLNFQKEVQPTTKRSTQEVHPHHSRPKSSRDAKFLSMKEQSVFENPSEESRYLKYLMKEKYTLYENQEQLAERSLTVRNLEQIIDQWQIEAAQKKQINMEAQENNRHVRVVSFGSYKLGVSFPFTDLDLICIFPSYITKEDFFQNLYLYLEKQEYVKDIMDVVDAKVPILKFNINGYYVDLLYASMDYIPSHLEKSISDETFFNKLIGHSQQSLSGLISSQNILSSVPNLHTFRCALKLIKFWAMRRQIYSHTLGYLGGISYSIMVTKICQDFPDLEFADIIYKFFQVYSEWKWIDPISIRVGKQKDKLSVHNLQVLNSLTANDLMPIMTPNFRPTNSSYRVTESTHVILLKELERGFKIMKQLAPATSIKMQTVKQQNHNSTDLNLEENKQDIQSPKKYKWTLLLKKYRFFTAFHHFIRVDVISVLEQTHKKWIGYVESQLRSLVELLNRSDEIDELRLLPRPFNRSETKDTINHAFKCCDSYFIGFKVTQRSPGQGIDLRSFIVQFCSIIDLGNLGRNDPQNNQMRILHFKRSDLPRELVQRY